jgi:hypothetical protein
MPISDKAERLIRVAVAWGIKSLVGEHKLNGTAVSRSWNRTAYDVQHGVPVGVQNSLVEERIERVLRDSNLLPGDCAEMQRRIHNAEACAQRFRGEDQEET